MQTHTKTTGRNGSTRIKHFDSNPEAALRKIMEARPRGRMTLAAYKRLILDKADIHIFQDDRYREALNMYCFQNMFNNVARALTEEALEEESPLPPKSPPTVSPAKRPAKTEAERAAEKAERDRLAEEAAGLATKAIQRRAYAMILDIVMPNGKTVAKNTGSYLEAHADMAGSHISELIKELARSCGKHTPEEAGWTNDRVKTDLHDKLSRQQR